MLLSRHMAQLETTSHDELCKLSLVDLKAMGKTHGIPCSNKNKSDLIIALTVNIRRFLIQNQEDKGSLIDQTQVGRIIRRGEEERTSSFR